MLSRIALIVLAIFYVCPAHASEPFVDTPNSYLKTLLDQANALRLSEHPVWRNLVHYKSHREATVLSEVDGEGFFASPTGKEDPQSELTATLAAFFTQNPVAPTKLTSQCRFIARYHWLDSILNFDETAMPRQVCKEYNDIYDAMQPESLTLVFPSTHPNSPSSLFGHTLLRVDKKNQTKETSMLAYSVNFAAMISPDENSFNYLLLGLTGGYKGMFSILPYYIKLREYAHLEDRDLWEYRLNLSPDQLRMVLMHAYELSYTYFDYYFFTENCSYHLLSLLDPVFADHPLTDEFPAWVVPIDTVKLLDRRGLIGEVSFHPALNTTIRQKLGHLNDRERKIALGLSNGDLTDDNSDVKTLPVNEQAAVYDMAFDMVRYKKIDSSEVLDTKLTQKERGLLKVRSQIPVRSVGEEITPPTMRPDYGHNSHRIAFGSGYANEQLFGKLEWRATYHDLLDPPQGFLPGYGIDFFNIELRIWQQDSIPRINRLKLLDIALLKPRDDFFKKWSWTTQIGWQRDETDTRLDANAAYMSGAFGVAYPLSTQFSATGYAFLAALGEIGTGANRSHHLAPGVQFGLTINTKARWQMELHTDAYFGLLGDDYAVGHIYTTQAFTLSRYCALRINTGVNYANGRRGIDSGMSLNWYY